ncbi:MAG: DNA-binding transcriptional regulator, LysR family [Amycolatopsis sp.]|jgi:DNA-binding transcriptional LysR family regulator|uniref:LysR family transcriptional regulator n=1 Tax=Amycolatopsis sp. TaxID=37632 RepID=UPI00260D3AB9|nr:LysR family transcriptional regulator [Amycolatopsis sp.]MCU1687886.1 DNA-binding transcriptional regulator, LysR family [Amycolatopsis sp.]
MDLRQLEYFVSVAEERSFSRGAERVHVVQSAVSTAVAKLERELDIRLLDRAAHPIALTPAGAAFLTEARGALAAARRARNSVAPYREQLSGSVDLGTLLSSGPLDLPSALGRFHARYPLVSVRLRQSVAGTTGHLEAVADGALDLALVAATTPPAHVTLRTIAREPLLLLCRPEHRLGARIQARVADLAGETIVRFAAGWGIRRQTDEAFAAAGIAPEAPYEVADYDTAAGLVRNRLGVALLPSTPAGRYSDLRAVPVTPSTTWTLALATSARFPVSPAAAALADALLEESRS